MRNADLRDVPAVSADFRDADLTDADLRGAELSGADLAGAVLTGVVCDRYTGWPAGFEPRGHGARLDR